MTCVQAIVFGPICRVDLGAWLGATLLSLPRPLLQWAFGWLQGIAEWWPAPRKHTGVPKHILWPPAFSKLHMVRKPCQAVSCFPHFGWISRASATRASPHRRCQESPHLSLLGRSHFLQIHHQRRLGEKPEATLTARVAWDEDLIHPSSLDHLSWKDASATASRRVPRIPRFGVPKDSNRYRTPDSYIYI